MSRLAERALKRIGQQGLVDGRPATGPLRATMPSPDEETQTVVWLWTIPTGIGRVGAKVVVSNKEWRIKALRDTGETGDTWVLKSA